MVIVPHQNAIYTHNKANTSPNTLAPTLHRVNNNKHTHTHKGTLPDFVLVILLPILLVDIRNRRVARIDVPAAFGLTAKKREKKDQCPWC